MGILSRIRLSQIVELGGSRILGEQRFANTGARVARLGDVNGDGIDDFILLAPDFDFTSSFSSEGRAYIIFGQDGGFGDEFLLADLDNTLGFTIDGLQTFGDFGDAATGADINGDGFNDIIIGSELQNSVNFNRGGSVFVRFGAEDGFSNITVDDLTGDVGFRLNGQNDPAGDLLGSDVDRAGDFNGDGIEDFIVGARLKNAPEFADQGGNADNSGEAYIVFGTTDGFPDLFTNDDIDGTNGITLQGFADASFGNSVAGIGDINGDGFDDVLIGAPFGFDNQTFEESNFAAVVFGSDSGLDPVIDLATLDGTDGFLLEGENGSDEFGVDVAGIGDVNGDGIDDFMIGAPGFIPEGAPENFEDGFGAAYVVFGSTGPFGPSFDISTLDGTNGFRMEGLVQNEALGSTVKGIGDFNGDGFDDLAVLNNESQAFVIFGTDQGFAADIDLTALDGLNGFVIEADVNNESISDISNAGDVNNDGFDDLLIGSGFLRNSGPVEFAGGAFILYGGPTGQRINGNDDPNTLTGGDFNDIIDGRGDVDLLIGGLGGDTYIFDNEDDRAIELAGEGIDKIISSARLNAQVAGFENIEIFELSGTANRLFGNDADQELIGNPEVGTSVFAFDGDDRLIGGIGNDRLNGGNGDDELIGGDGNDRLDGGAGADFMRGGLGNDTYFVNDPGDVVSEFNREDGIDQVRSRINFTLSFAFENLRLQGTANEGTGNSADNTIFTVAPNSILRGLGGNDNLRGSNGDDQLFGDDGNDAINGRSGNDVIEGGRGNDFIRGRSGEDEIFGGEGVDLIIGGRDNDFLSGGAGQDELKGEGGADTFAFADGDFAGLTAEAADRITDFNQVEDDVIDLADVDAITGTAEDDAFTFIADAAFTGTAGELRFEQVDGNTMVFMDTDGDGAADHAIRLDGLITLTEADFVL